MTLRSRQSLLRAVIGLTTAVPVQCLYAYNMPIQRCTPDDFSIGASCSQSCISGLQAAQFTVRGLCFSVNAPANSLLKQIQDGHIVDVLCGVNKAPIPTTPASVVPPKTTPPIPAPSSNPDAPRPIFSTLSTSTTQSQTTSSSALPEATTSTPTSETSSTSTESQDSTTSEAASSLPTASTTEDASSPTPQPSNDDQPSSSTRNTKPKPTRPPNLQPGSGGGSPFDFVASSRATNLELAGGSIAFAIAIASATLALL
ncbi:hypothetical protein M419DRAFT_128163 [Trichoderma reesei RUT C-30]|uniref:Extracellular membrane protein CFEM domain-containing protein n=1 Tax=Hypocrea jecorina (strain ATCC 56765 / BCRC 32924 / NRRL 11460 / Rut C-30) TaxID=1344414 RepID=A0A024SEI3_HYPJR|nr:hypothetical protein M419DRAFT_128163 [Trichoderma reesei RUT C-30]